MDQKKKTLLTFKWGVSKGRNTYGYSILSLFADGQKVASTCGGGYDMRGSVLGEYIKANYLQRLTTIAGNTGSLDTNVGFYGLSFYDKNHKNHKYYQEGDSVHLDGACGENCMTRIASAIGVELTPVRDSNDSTCYILTDILK